MIELDERSTEIEGCHRYTTFRHLVIPGVSTETSITVNTVANSGDMPSIQGSAENFSRPHFEMSTRWENIKLCLHQHRPP